MLPFYGKEYLDMIPLIHGESSMKNFLSSDEKSYTKEDVDRIFGWPKVDNFTENVFRTIETHFGEQRNVQAALVKSRAWRSTVDHFCWNCEIPNSPIKYISDPNTLLRSGINALNQGDIGAAVNFLKFAEKFSNFEKFELIQFALATCFHAANKHEEAKNHIYRALAINPDCAEYQNFNNRIKAAEL
jgi:tetratricopeptide (TPR) repeat protein